MGDNETFEAGGKRRALQWTTDESQHRALSQLHDDGDQFHYLVIEVGDGGAILAGSSELVPKPIRCKTAAEAMDYAQTIEDRETRDGAAMNAKVRRANRAESMVWVDLTLEDGRTVCAGRLHQHELDAIDLGNLRLTTMPNSDLAYPDPFPGAPQMLWGNPRAPYAPSLNDDCAFFVITADGARRWMRCMATLARLALDVQSIVWREVASKKADRKSADFFDYLIPQWAKDLGSDEAQQVVSRAAAYAAQISPEGGFTAPGLFAQPSSWMTADEYNRFVQERFDRCSAGDHPDSRSVFFVPPAEPSPDRIDFEVAEAIRTLAAKGVTPQEAYVAVKKERSAPRCDPPSVAPSLDPSVASSD